MWREDRSCYGIGANILMSENTHYYQFVLKWDYLPNLKCSAMVMSGISIRCTFLAHNGLYQRYDNGALSFLCRSIQESRGVLGPARQAIDWLSGNRNISVSDLDILSCELEGVKLDPSQENIDIFCNTLCGVFIETATKNRCM